MIDMAQAAMATAQEEAEAAQDAAADLALRLRMAEEEREAVAARLAQLEASAAVKDAEARAAEASAAELLARMTVQLESMRAEVAAAEASAIAAANLAEASAAAATALLEANAAVPAAACTPRQPTPEVLHGPHPEAFLAELEAAQMLPGQLPVFNNASLAALGRPSPAAFRPRAVSAIHPAALATAAAAALGLAALAVALHLRGRRRLAAKAARCAALAARLKEAAFARDTAEQSLGLLERELQRRMKQLEDVQQAAAEAGGWAGVGGWSKAASRLLLVCIPLPTTCIPGHTHTHRSVSPAPLRCHPCLPLVAQCSSTQPPRESAPPPHLRCRACPARSAPPASCPRRPPAWWKSFCGTTTSWQCSRSR